MRELLLKLTRRQDLSRDEARSAFEAIMSGGAEPAQVAALLMALAVKGETVDEVVGAASVMREKSVRVQTPDGELVLDTCGTGGDVKHTFNISTAAAIVVASCGVKVVKHGNRSASSQSGSADVLEALGVKIDLAPDQQYQSLCDANLCFAFARAHHPAMKFVAPIRAALGVPTLFNMLGPLTNPGRARHQLLGVFKPELTLLFARVLRELGSERAWVVHGEDGLDELSTMSPTKVVELTPDGGLRDWTLDAQRELGMPRAKLEDLQVSDAQASAGAIRDVFAGKQGPKADIVALNAAAGLVIADRAKTLKDALAMVRRVLSDGTTAHTLEQLKTHSNQP